MQSTHPTIIIFTIIFLSFFHHLLTHQVKARNKYAWRQSGCSTSSIFGHACTAQSCSESFLQHFDDAVITFIRQRNNLMHVITALMKHYYKDSEQLLVVHVWISSWCNYKPLLPWPSSHTKSGGSKKSKGWKHFAYHLIQPKRLSEWTHSVSASMKQRWKEQDHQLQL